MADQKDYLDAVGLAEPGLNRVIREGYALLGLLTYFTVGPKEARAWTITRAPKRLRRLALFTRILKRASSALKPLPMLITLPTMVKPGAKTAGKFRLEGKEYVVDDGDVMHFRFNT